MIKLDKAALLGRETVDGPARGGKIGGGKGGAPVTEAAAPVIELEAGNLLGQDSRGQVRGAKIGSALKGPAAR